MKSAFYFSKTKFRTNYKKITETNLMDREKEGLILKLVQDTIKISIEDLVAKMRDSLVKQAEQLIDEIIIHREGSMQLASQNSKLEAAKKGLAQEAAEATDNPIEIEYHRRIDKNAYVQLRQLPDFAREEFLDNLKKITETNLMDQEKEALILELVQNTIGAFMGQHASEVTNITRDLVTQKLQLAKDLQNTKALYRELESRNLYLRREFNTYPQVTMTYNPSETPRTIRVKKDELTPRPVERIEEEDELDVQALQEMAHTQREISRGGSCPAVITSSGAM